MKLSNEAKIGLMVSVVVLILLYLTFKSGNFNFSRQGYLLNVLFRNIDGISLNAPVMLNGLEVGHVKKISIEEKNEETLMKVSVWLEDRVRLREGSSAYVKNMGFMGEKYIGLTSGRPGARILPAETYIMGKDPADLDKLMLDAREVAKQVKEITTNLNERLQNNDEKIDNIFTNLDTSMENLVAILNNIDERLEMNAAKIDHFVDNMESSSTNLDQFTYDLKLHPWKLLYRSKEKRAKSIEKLMEEESRP